MSKAANFITWIMEDTDRVTAMVDTPRDQQLKEFAEQGFLKFAFTTHDTNTYEITGHYLKD